MTDGRADTAAYAMYPFLIEIDGVPAGGFSETSALSDGPTAVDGRRMRAEDGSRKVMPRFDTRLTLRFGVMRRDALPDGPPDMARHAVRLLLRRPGHDVVRVWAVHAAIVTGWTGATSPFEGPHVGVETLELTHEGITPEEL